MYSVRDRRAHEDEVVVEVAAVQDLGRHRVEEGLGELGLVVVDEQADVVQLDLLPDVHRQLAGLELALQPLGRLVDALVVELDALALGPLLAVPVGRLEARLRRGAGLAEQPVVAVEAVEHRLAMSKARASVKPCGNIGPRPRSRLPACRAPAWRACTAAERRTDTRGVSTPPRSITVMRRSSSRPLCRP